jgi:hypothetical protein
VRQSRRERATPPTEDPNIAPEAPGSLVVLNVRAEDGLLDFAVYRWDPGPQAQPGQLFVLWRAKSCPTGYKEVANGVVCVAAPPTYEQREYEAWPRATLDPLVLSWEDADTTGGGLMLVAALPEGYAFAGAVDGAPDPVEAKPFDGRMAVFWRLSGMRVHVSWRISPLAGRDLRAYSAEINERLRPPSGDAIEDPPPPPAEVLRHWADAQRAPIAGPPPDSPPSHSVIVFGNVEGLYSGQIGAAGPGAQARDFTQVWAQIEGQIELAALADALAELRGQLRERATETEHDRGIGLVADAEEAARRGDGPAVLERLRAAGGWVRDTATAIGVPVVTAALRAAFGLA